MRTFIVPVDFSDQSLESATYAMRLSEKHKARVILLYSWHIPHTHASMLKSVEEVIHRTSLENLEEFSRKIPQTNNQGTPDLIVKRGEVVRTILDYAKTQKEPLIIMGTHGASGFRELLGTNTAALIASTTIPVLVLPEGSRFNDIGNVTFATGMESFTLSALDILVELISPFRPEFTILHVESGRGYVSAADKDSIRSQIGWTRAIFVEKDNKDVESALEEYMQNERPDLFCMATRQRGWFKRIIEKSISRIITMHAKIPVLICPATSDADDFEDSHTD